LQQAEEEEVFKVRQHELRAEIRNLQQQQQAHADNERKRESARKDEKQAMQVPP
jgi:cell division protein FtsL